MRFNVRLSAGLLCLLMMLPLHAAENQALEQRYQSLIHDIRCVVCQNQSIAESSATIAKDMRDWVHQALLEGKTDADIQSELITHYGDFVLYQPRFQSNTWILWLGPAVLALLMFIIARQTGNRNTMDGLGVKNYSTSQMTPLFPPTAMRGKVIAGGGFILIFLFLIAGYRAWGGSSKIQEFKALQQFDAALQVLVQEIPKLDQAVFLERLKHFSSNSDANPIVLARLGSLYAALQWWQEAAEVYWRAYQETGAVDVGSGYLNAVFMLQNGKLSDKDKTVMLDILAKDPNNTAALNLKALEAFSEKRYPEAKSIWIQIRTQLEPGSSLYDTITEAINRAGE